MIWLEILIGFAVPAAWGVWQLIDLKREARLDAEKARVAAATSATAASAGSAGSSR